MLKNMVKACIFFALMLTMLTGCVKTSGKSGKMTITWCGTYNQSVEPDSGVQRYLEEKFDVNLDVVSITSNYTQRLNAMIASNQIPDVFFIGEPEEWTALADQGVIVEVPVSLIEEYVNSQYQLINTVDPALWGVSSYKGKNWTIPRIYAAENNTVAVWRKDWLEAVGIEKIPETIAEFEEAFIRFRNNDPDGNGIKDTYALSGMGGHPARLFDTIFAAFGVMPNQWELVDDKIMNSTVDPRTKEALILLNNWYEKGLIDPEFVTDDVTTLFKRFEDGKTGMFFDALSSQIESMPGGKQFFGIWEKINPNAELSIGPPPEGENGHRGDWQWGPRGNFIVFGRQLENDLPKMQKIMTMLDTINSDEETALRVVWGEIGRTYDYNDPEIGAKSGLKFLPPYDIDSNERAREGISANCFFNMLQPQNNWALPSVTDKYMPSDYLEKRDELASFETTRDVLLRPYLPSSPMYQKTLEKAQVMAHVQFITGERSISEWETFVQEWLSQGGERLTQEAQAFYEENIKPHRQ